jgi:acyl-CoA reductase-like NAD-dependent aldehyde dehydrogenase
LPGGEAGRRQLAGHPDGPLNDPAQRDQVAELVEDAVAHGATVAAGGKVVDGPGFFYEPAVVTDLSDGVCLVDEEQFGLGSSLWGTDGQRAAAVAGRLEAGMTRVNGHGAPTVDQPFAGIKWSGIGIENRHWALEGFTELQVVHRTK